MALAGYLFSPSDDLQARRRLNQAMPGTQEALKVLSLRLPNVLGGHPLSADDILRSRPGAGAPGAVVSSLLGANTSTTPQPRIPTNITAPGASPFSVLTPTGSESGQLASAADASRNGFGTPSFTYGKSPTDQPAAGTGAGTSEAGVNDLFDLVRRSLSGESLVGRRLV